ncbi:MAG: hypothetical protein ACJ70U_01205 [Nitrososphaera sp.]
MKKAPQQHSGISHRLISLSVKNQGCSRNAKRDIEGKNFDGLANPSGFSATIHPFYRIPMAAVKQTSAVQTTTVL